MKHSAFEHPYFLTLVILYSAAFGVAFTSFPPIRRPFVSADVLQGTMLLMFVSFITLSYAYAEASRTYRVGLFLLNAVVAILFAWSFRLLDMAGDELAARRSGRTLLITYYSSCAGLFLTMVLFSHWTRATMRTKGQRASTTQYFWPRVIGFL